jgi:hypothetical protein
MKCWLFYLLVCVILLPGCSRSEPAVVTRLATATTESTPTIEVQQLQAEARALASESGRLWNEGDYSQALALAVKAVQVRRVYSHL